MAGRFLQRSRHGTTYFFRRRIPDDLRGVLGRCQLYRSLGTVDVREAVVRARALAVEIDRLFAHIRDTTKSTKDNLSRIDLGIEMGSDVRGRPLLRRKAAADADAYANTVRGVVLALRDQGCLSEQWSSGSTSVA
jgi:hypothetical protein